PRQPPAKPICTALAAIQLVGGRRPSMLQRWGSGVLPRRFPVAIWSGLHPDTPHQCVRAQCGFRFSSASSPTRSLTFGR
ncbi:hypothetical protein LAY46_23940, partial [Escherichia coli]|nr:hypothetical protein [Escherichia coli]